MSEHPNMARCARCDRRVYVATDGTVHDIGAGFEPHDCESVTTDRERPETLEEEAFVEYFTPKTEEDDYGQEHES